VDVLADLDAVIEPDAGRRQPLLLARAPVRLDGIAVRLARLRRALAAARGDASARQSNRNAAGG
jgi:hypothetical protein